MTRCVWFGAKVCARRSRRGGRIPPCRSSNEFRVLNAHRKPKMPFPEPARVPTVGEILPSMTALTPVPNRAMNPKTTARTGSSRCNAERPTRTIGESNTTRRVTRAVGWDKLASSAGPPMSRSLLAFFSGWWAGAAKRRWSHPTKRDIFGLFSATRSRDRMMPLCQQAVPLGVRHGRRELALQLPVLRDVAQVGPNSGR